MTKNICSFPPTLGSPSSYMTLQLLPSEFPYIRGICIFFFISVDSLRCTLLRLLIYSHIPTSPTLQLLSADAHTAPYLYLDKFGGLPSTPTQPSPCSLHCEKRLAVFPSPAGTSLTSYHTLPGREKFNYSRPLRVW